MGELLEILVPAAAVVLAAVFAFGWRRAKKLVQETENKWDDALFDAFDQGYEAARKEAAEEKAE